MNSWYYGSRKLCVKISPKIIFVTTKYRIAQNFGGRKLWQIAS